jgi:AraC family transcriptional regulator
MASSRMLSAPIAVRTPRGALLSVTELRPGVNLGEVMTSLPREPAAVLLFQMPCGGVTLIGQLEPDLPLPRFAHCLLFYISRNALTELGDSRETTPSPAHADADRCVESLARALFPVLQDPHRADRLFVGELLYALTAHVALRYCGAPTSTLDPSIRLAPWQERRAKELMKTRLSGISVAELAAECRLSPGHFARAFRHCTGLTPHRWLLSCRIARSKELILESRATLREIASSCGFSDQSHLSRAFVRMTGVTPAAWRRSRVPREHFRGRRKPRIHAVPKG